MVCKTVTIQGAEAPPPECTVNIAGYEVPCWMVGVAAVVVAIGAVIVFRR